MLYKGGGCNQTVTNQQVPCFDFQGGPSAEPGSEGFVVVTFQSTVYHSAWVTIGSQYRIRDPNGGELGASQSIVVYQSEDLSPSNVLQSLIFDGSCTESLQLMDQYGASQVVGFTVDGIATSAFFNATIDLGISVPSASPALRLAQLVVDSSEGPFNLSDQVAGAVLEGGQRESADFSLTLDLTVPRNVLFLSTVLARNVDSSSLNCTAESFLSVPVGPVDAVQSGNLANASFVPSKPGGGGRSGSGAGGGGGGRSDHSKPNKP